MIYTVNLEVVGHLTYEIKANSQEEAIAAALSQFEDADVGELEHVEAEAYC